MPTQNAFSVYASNFINQSFAGTSRSTDSDSQPPLFFSFTEADDSQFVRRPSDDETDVEDDIDDHGRPILRGGGQSGSLIGSGNREEDDVNPYIHFDDESESGDNAEGGGGVGESIPMITSLGFSRQSQAPRRQELSDDDLGSISSQHSDSGDMDDRPPDHGHLSSPEPPVTRIELTESLLPRDNLTRSIFSLPEPGRIPRHKYNDSIWIVIWCTLLLVCAVGFILALFLTHVRPPYGRKLI
jgi:hypothetical protein